MREGSQEPRTRIDMNEHKLLRSFSHYHENVIQNDWR